MTGEGVGRVVDGRFELLERLGGGGMGLVWRARDMELHRDVALKEVRPPDPRFAESPTREAAVLRERVLREARALARLRHPQVVTIFHIVTGEEAAFPWLVMELVPGGSLADRLKQGPLPPAGAARLGRGLLSGLRAAHSAGILHRDVKPANVLMREDGSPVLTDFGIAALSELTALTSAGALIGSPEYIAPERIRGQEGDPSSDLWSLGMLLYVAVEGAHPLHRGTVLATLAAVLDESVPAPTRAGPLTGVLTALLSRDPGDRPDTGELDRLLAEAEARAETEAGPRPGTKTAPRPGTGAGTRPDTEGAAPDGPGATVGSRTAAAAPAPRPDAAPKRAPGRASQPPEPGPAPAAPGYPDMTTRSAPAPAAPPPADSEPRAEPASAPAPEDRAAKQPPDAEPEDRATKQPPDAEPERADTSSRPRRRRIVRKLIGVAAALALVAAAVNYLPGLLAEARDRGTSVIGIGPQQSDDYLFTPKGVREAITKLKPMTGSSTVSSMSSHGSHLTIAAPRKDNPEVMHWYSYRDGKASDDGPAGVVKQPPALALEAFDWDLLPALWREAQNGLGIKNAEASHMILHRNPDTGLELTLYVRDDYGSAWMKADNKGRTIYRSPRETVNKN
ncbi:serine/threonine-protein kinase [Streptomyces sp. NPDC052042]|uniref:serine/threonine-protein kinase n=1 Tax=Streptomyces sp. NPDC052042 TaxID=3365683 RepID=UPI0037D342A9